MGNENFQNLMDEFSLSLVPSETEQVGEPMVFAVHGDKTKLMTNLQVLVFNKYNLLKTRAKEELTKLGFAEVQKLKSCYTILGMLAELEGKPVEDIVSLMRFLNSKNAKAPGNQLLIDLRNQHENLKKKWSKLWLLFIDELFPGQRKQRTT